MKKQQIIIFGSTGMLGRALEQEAKKRKINTIGISKTSDNIHIDITNDKQLYTIVDKIKPDIIINSAAIINLEICENNPGLAYLINARAAGILANITQKKGIYLIHISTDHYYTGDRNKKHTERDKVILLNEYARTKYAGENFVLSNSDALIVRTNILGFKNIDGEPTFVEWAIDNLINKSSGILFNDYYTSSIHVRQLAISIFDIIQKRPSGILNIASREVISKKNFVVLIALKLGYSLGLLRTGSVSNKTKIIRAESLGLDVSKAEKILGYNLPVQEEVVQSILEEFHSK